MMFSNMVLGPVPSYLFVYLVHLEKSMSAYLTLLQEKNSLLICYCLHRWGQPGLEKMFISLEPQFREPPISLWVPGQITVFFQRFPSENTSFSWNQVPKFHIFSTPGVNKPKVQQPISSIKPRINDMGSNFHTLHWLHLMVVIILIFKYFSLDIIWCVSEAWDWTFATVLLAS